MKHRLLPAYCRGCRIKRDERSRLLRGGQSGGRRIVDLLLRLRRFYRIALLVKLLAAPVDTVALIVDRIAALIHAHAVRIMRTIQGLDEEVPAGKVIAAGFHARIGSLA